MREPVNGLTLLFAGLVAAVGIVFLLIFRWSSLPLLVLVIAFLDLVGLQQTNRLRPLGLRIALLQTVILLGVFIVLQSELLSVFRALEHGWVAFLWGLALLVTIGFGLKYSLLANGWSAVNKGLRSLSKLEVVFGAPLGVIIFLLLVVAYLSIPNNLDSLGYHMSRVVHWAQDRSLAHYPVAFEPQLLNPIGAELVILNLRLLRGNDQLANLVQLFSMVMSLIGVSTLAALFGASRKGQVVAVAFAASIPMGILQATSTQNDYVASLWLVCLAVFVVLAIKHEVSPTELLCLAAALGLGLLTKGTFYPYAVPFGVWLIIHWLGQRKLLIFLKRGILIVAIVIILNLGFWVRNTITYGGPLGSQKWVSRMTSSDTGIIPFAARLVENVALNYAPPDEPTTNRMLAVIRSVFQSVYPNISNFQFIWRWNHEDVAGNPLHMSLIPVSLVLLLLLTRSGRVQDHTLLWYSLAVLGSFVVLTLVTHYDQYGTRYQLPFIVAWAPVLGFVISKLGERRLPAVAAFLFLMAALPWVFFNTSRPLIAVSKNPEMFSVHPKAYLTSTEVSSVLIAQPTMVLFANQPYLRIPFMTMTKALKASGCDMVGLYIDSHDIEYPYWWLLGAPQNGVRVEVLNYSDKLARYVDPSFKPCAIICTICTERTRLFGLDLAGTYPDVRLFLGGGYDPDKNK